jgi:hypothetical protein
MKDIQFFKNKAYIYGDNIGAISQNIIEIN